jgi:hypothetical protein
VQQIRVMPKQPSWSSIRRHQPPIESRSQPAKIAVGSADKISGIRIPVHNHGRVTREISHSGLRHCQNQKTPPPRIRTVLGSGYQVATPWRGWPLRCGVTNEQRQEFTASLAHLPRYLTTASVRELTCSFS